MDQLFDLLPQIGVNPAIAFALALPLGGILRLAKTHIALNKRYWPWIALALGVLAGLASVGLTVGGGLTGLIAGALAITGNEGGKLILPGLMGKAKEKESK